jgi:hypothetical protein
MRAFWLALIFFVASSANAGVVTLNYSFTGFMATAPTDPVTLAPADPVVGRITYQAASIASPIERLLSVDMTIAGHVYSLAEIGFADGLIGGLVSGIEFVASDTNDFVFLFDAPGSTARLFIYAVENNPSNWFSNLGSLQVTFADVPNPVSEPGPLALLFLGLMCAVAASKRTS